MTLAQFPSSLITVTFAFLESLVITSAEVLASFLKFTELVEIYPVFCDELLSLFSSSFFSGSSAFFSTSFDLILSVLTQPEISPVFI